MSNANTPEMMAQSMAESLFRENARLKKIEESYYRLLELDSGDVMIDMINENDRLKEQNALLTVQVPEGWKLVPVVPTADMIIAASDGYETGEVIGPASCYRVMIAAAPDLSAQD